MIRSLFTAAALVALTACAAVPVAPVDASIVGPASNRETGYLTAGVLDGKAILGPPPAPDSPHGRADRQVFEDTRALQGTARWNEAIADNDLWQGTALKRYACALGKTISAERTPTAWRMLRRIEVDVRTVGTPTKTFYGRTRPLIGNDRPVCVPREDWMRTNASYPSGHAMVGWAWALILTELAPGRADALLRTGREMGESRVVCGVHFPSDIEAGRTLSAGMVARLHAEPAFEADLARARREIAAAPPANCPA